VFFLHVIERLTRKSALYKNTCILTTKAAGSYKTVVPINQLNNRPTDEQINQPSWVTSCNFIHHALQYKYNSKLQPFQYSHLKHISDQPAC